MRLHSIAALLAATTLSLSAFADNEWLHIYRNDRQFHSLPLSQVRDFSYEGSEAQGFTALSITADGETLRVPLSAIDSCAIGAQVPIIRISLTEHPEMTELVEKDTYLKAKVSLEGNGYCDDISSWDTQIKGRGNSTWSLAKKPYRLKGDKKVALGGLKKAKSFALIANYLDPTLMRNSIALWVANRLGMPFANHSVPALVYFNDIFKGAYMLTEKIGIGSASVDIEESTGILFELDTSMDEEFCFTYSWDEGKKQLPVMVKDPDLHEIAALDESGATTAEHLLDGWRLDFNAMAHAVVNTPTDGDISQYIDLESAVNYMLVNTIAGNHELDHPKSLYMYKERMGSTEAYHLGPVWDFDWAFNYQGTSAAPYNSVTLLVDDANYHGCSFLKALCRNEAFMVLYRERWQQFMEQDYAALLSYMDSYAALIEPSAKADGVAWPDDFSASWAPAYSSYDFRAAYSALREWLVAHIAWCDSHPNLGVYR